MNKTTAVIIARGGSTRVPRKNVMDICGHPLIAWSIRQALGCKYVEDVWVTTEDREIKEVALRYGAKVIDRPAYLSANHVAGTEPTCHAMKYLESKGLKTELFLSIAPTICLRLPGDYDRLFEKHAEYTKDGPLEKFGIGFAIRLQDVWTRRIGRDGFLETLIFDKSNTCADTPGGCGITYWDDVIAQAAYMREALGEEILTDAAIDAAAGKLELNIALQRTGFCEIEAWQAYDINVPRDVDVVRTMMEHKILKGKGIEIYG